MTESDATTEQTTKITPPAERAPAATRGHGPQAWIAAIGVALLGAGVLLLGIDALVNDDGDRRHERGDRGAMKMPGGGPHLNGGRMGGGPGMGGGRGEGMGGRGMSPRFQGSGEGPGKPSTAPEESSSSSQDAK